MLLFIIQKPHENGKCYKMHLLLRDKNDKFINNVIRTRTFILCSLLTANL